MPFAQAWLPEISAWVAVAIAIISALATAAGLFYRLGRSVGELQRSIEDRFSYQGRRLGRNEDATGQNTAKIESLKSTDQHHELSILGLTGDVGRLRGDLDRTAGILDRWETEQDKLKERTIDRLGRIEEKLDIYIDLHERRPK